MLPTYPRNRVRCMNREGPDNTALVVPEGTLRFSANRDSRFPYLYEVKSHPLVHDVVAVRRIFVYIQDTSPDALKRHFDFEEELYVPLGPDANMSNLGLFDLEDGTVIYARAMGSTNPADDVIIAWNFLGSRVFNETAINELISVRDRILGPAELMTRSAPTRDNNGSLNGGTHFERLGQQGVKGTRCYSLTQTHQHSRALVGPAAGGKVYDFELTENECIRRDAVCINAKLGMESLRRFAPPQFLATLEENAEANNIPRMGDPGNVAFPAGQLNISPAVSFKECLSQGLEGMGEFGAVKGHRDLCDSEGGLTEMHANSRLPDGYEPGRFHLLGLGCYVRLEHSMVMAFCGLNRHGGSPPIAPPGEDLVPHAYRLMTVLYPPRSMMSGAGVQVTPLASLPNGELLKLGPEITSYLGLTEKQRYSNEACWTLDGRAIMDRYSHFQHVSRLTLQLVSYIFQQFPPEYECLIDADKFFEACTIADNADIGDNTPLPPQTTRNRINAGTWKHAPDGAIYDTYMQGIQSADDIPEGSRNAVVKRRQQIFKWIDHLENRSRFIPLQHDVDFNKEREKIKQGQLGLRGAKSKTTNATHKRSRSDGGGIEPRKSKRIKANEQLQNIGAKLHANIPRVTLPMQPDLPETSKTKKPNKPKNPKRPTGKDKKAAQDTPSNNRSETEPVQTQNMERPGNNSESEVSDSSEDEDSDDEEVLPTPSGLAIARIHPVEEGRSETEGTSTRAKNHKVDEFLQSLNDAAIESVAGEFAAALMIKPTNWAFSNLQHTSDLCASVFQVVRQKPVDPETASSIVAFWGHVSQMESMITLANVSTRASKVMIMLSTWTMLDWIATTVEGSLENPSPEGSWVSRLLHDIKSSIQQVHRQKTVHGGLETVRPSRTRKNNAIVHTLKPQDYLPHLENAEDFTFAVPRFFLDEDRMKISMRRVATDAIACWLTFPLTSAVIAKCSLIGTLLECGSTAILFLDQVWLMFKSPFQHVIHSKPNQRQASRHTAAVLEEFHKQFLIHPIMDAKSKTYSLLSNLNGLSVKWGARSKITLTPRTRNPTGGTSANNDTEMSIDANLNLQERRSLFSDFLKRFLPLVKDGFDMHRNSADKFIKKTAERPDYFLPFRSQAPTFQRALHTILSNKDRLRTQAGLFNLAAFRGVFYGSEFARTELRWFNSFNDWTQYQSSHSMQEKFYVNQNAYGPFQGDRSTSLLGEYWKICGKGWERHQKENPNLDAVKLFNFFQKFKNIGPLAAFLMVGDLVDCEFLPVPTPEAMGQLISCLDKGAMKGLTRLGLVAGNAKEDDIATAFVDLHKHLATHLSAEDQKVIGYNVVMLEHALCKYQRIYRLPKRVKEFYPLKNPHRSRKKT